MWAVSTRRFEFFKSQNRTNVPIDEFRSITRSGSSLPNIERLLSLPSDMFAFVSSSSRGNLINIIVTYTTNRSTT